MRIAIIGGGSIGTALAEILLSSAKIAKEDLLLLEKDEERLTLLKERDAFVLRESIGEFIKEYDYIVLAIKPQYASALCRDLKELLRQDQCVVSFIAGYTLSILADALGAHPNLIRAMPNLPIKVGAGMTVFTALNSTDKGLHNNFIDWISATGAYLEVSDEKLLDAATAVTGSGPGFIYYLMEHYLNAAAELGFPEEDLTKLVSATFKGVSELLIAEQRSPRELREMVATKGGTTEAGIRVFRENQLGDILVRGIKAACERSCQLAEGVK